MSHLHLSKVNDNTIHIPKNMNTRPITTTLATLRICTLAGVCGLTAGNLNAQAWQTVDDVQQAPGLNSRALALGTDPTKSLLYSAGWAIVDSSGTEAAVVRASADSGATWTTLDAWVPAGLPIAAYQGFCSAPNGYLFAGGDMCNNDLNTATIDWFVRRSTDGGATWSTQDTVDSGIGGKAQCRAIQAAPSGDIYAAGLTGTNQGNGGWVWLVRKSADSGATWTTVDSLWDNNVKEARAIGFGQNASLFVAGMLANSWTVRRSTDRGATWATVDSYRPSGSLTSEAWSVAADSVGNIYVAGNAVAWIKGRYANQWVVRRTTNNGASWTTVDNVTIDYSSNSSGPTGITVGPAGALFVGGYGTATDGSLYWLVRKGLPGAKGSIAWSTSDTYQLQAGESARANALTSDAFGNTYVAGRAADATGDHWVIRQLLP